jgi:proline iminopeptidase
VLCFSAILTRSSIDLHTRCIRISILSTVQVNPFERKMSMYVKVNGTRLFFDVVGSSLQPTEEAMQPKPTLIALHGGPGIDHSAFRPDFDPLGELAQLIYVDLRGQGRSARQSNEYYQVGIMADDIADFCAELGIEKPVVLGVSFGGFIALSLAVRHPELLGGLILCSTVPAARGYDLDALEQLAGKELREIAGKEWVGRASEEEMRRFQAEVLPHYWQYFQPEYLNVFSKTILNEEIGPYMQAKLGTEYDVRAQLGSITIPTLVLHGRYDWVCPFTEAQQMAEQIPHARLHILEHSRHVVHHADLDEALKVISEFLR